MAYDNPHGLIAAAVVAQAIVYAVVALRLFTRYKHGKKYFVADWLILLAAILSTGLAVIQIHGAAVRKLGVPVHGTIGSPTFEESVALNLRWYQWGVFINGVVVTGLIKISVAFFYLQIFSTRKFRRILVPWLVLMIMWSVGFTILMLSFCGHNGLWPQVPLAKEKTQCLSGQKIGYAIVLGHMISDFITVIIPLPMIWTLQLSTKRKLAVMAVFAIGLLSVGGSVAKAYIYVSSSLKKTTMDYATIITSISVWGLVESQAGIIAACLITLRPLLKNLTDSKLFSRLKNSSRNLIGTFTSRSHFSESKVALSKVSSERTGRLPSIGGTGTCETKILATHSRMTLPGLPHAINVEQEVDVDVSRR